MSHPERSWTRAILAAFAPPEQASQQTGDPARAACLYPRPGEVDYLRAFHRMSQAATRKAAFGLRVAVLLIGLSPMWLGRRLKLFTQLSMREQTEVLAQLLRHRLFAVRELTLLMKFVAAMALLGHDDVRTRSGYDRVQAPELSESGVRHRLPLLTETPPAPGAGDVG